MEDVTTEGGPMDVYICEHHTLGATKVSDENNLPQRFQLIVTPENALEALLLRLFYPRAFVGQNPRPTLDVRVV